MNSRLERLASKLELTMASPNNVADIPNIVSELRKSVHNRYTHAAEWRESQLQALLQMVHECRDDFIAALKIDMGKSEFEAQLSELNTIKVEAAEALASVRNYMAPSSVSVPTNLFPSSGMVVPEPLALMPLVGAIAAGNCVIIKPSEISSASSKALANAVSKFLDPRAIRVIEGGQDVCTELLTNHRFDHILFTGSTKVGKIVYEAAAKQLTPVTLELGGKSPALIVDTSANLRLAARKVLWGKSMNCGQICVAPDYCIVLKDLSSEFYEILVEVYNEMFPAPLKESKDYGRIINDHHTQRLVSLLNEKDLDILAGGEYDIEKKYVAPAIFRKTKSDAKVMEEEIFGPLLPVIEVDTCDEAIQFVNERPNPLALYLFTNDQSTIDRIVNETSSGGVGVNDVIVHLSVSGLPFGGVGGSGFGSYHGKRSFDTFSHMKPVLHQSGKDIFDFNIRYPPYDDNKKWWMNKLF